MKNILFVTVTLLSWIACSPPAPQKSQQLYVEQEVPTIIVSDSNVETIDTPEVILDYPITVQLSSTALHLADQSTTLDKLGEIRVVEIRIHDDSITSVKINGVTEFGASTNSWTPPVEYIDARHVRVLEGATLSFIAQYYNKRLETLIQCNKDRIPNPDRIPVGTVVTLSCCYTCD